VVPTGEQCKPNIAILAPICFPVLHPSDMPTIMLLSIIVHYEWRKKFIHENLLSAEFRVYQW
jgi:hypothetical protein